MSLEGRHARATDLTESPTFVRDDRSFSRLADAVAPGPTALDAETLAARILLLSPRDLSHTAHIEVRAHHPGVLSESDLAVLDRRGTTERTPIGAARTLREALEASVDRALRGVRCVAVLAGGGLDSAGLLALACAWGRRHGARVFAVALDFASDGDDRPYLAALEQHLGCEVVRCKPEDGAAHFDVFSRGVDAAPFTWPGGPMEIAAFARARREGAELVLTGSGGDQLFDGHPRMLADRVATQGWLPTMRDARGLEGFWATAHPALDWVVRPRVARHVPRAIRRWRASGIHQPPSWAGPVTREFLRAWASARIEEGLRDMSTVAARRSAFLCSPHREHLLWLRHQENVVANIPSWDPYLDPVLIDEVLRFPPDWLLHGNVRRGLFREAMRGLLPEGLRTRLDKAAFEPAFLSLFRAANGFRRLLPFADARELAALGIVDRSAFREAADAFLRDPEAEYGWTSILPALATEAFVRAHYARES